MEKYLAKSDKISTSIIKFILFLIAMIIIPKLNILSGFIESAWSYILGAILLLTLLEIFLYFKKGEDYIEVTENGLKLETKFGLIRECNFNDEFKYNYRRRKLVSIVVLNQKRKAIMVATNRYSIELSEIKSIIEKRQESLNTDV